MLERWPELIESGRDRPPTARQRLALAAIVRHYREAGCGPTFRELMRDLGVSSTNAVTCHLLALARRGLIAYEQGRGSGRRRGHAGTIRVPGLRVAVSFDESEAGARLRAALGEGAGGGL
jgi:SOS-response transcriptional repressor LexA